MIPLSSDLPNELVVRILNELASSDRKSCLALCLVSSWTHRIALPHLLHTVLITERNCTTFSKRVVISQCSSYVKRLWINTEDRSACFALISCRFITALTASSNLFLSSEFDNPPPFQFLTHLCITRYPLINSDTELITRMFPQLTHIAGIVYSERDLEFHRALFRAYGAQLVMVVARMDDVWSDIVVLWLRKVRKNDKRAYLVSAKKGGWKEDTSGKDSVWDSARKETQRVLVWDEMSDDS